MKGNEVNKVLNTIIGFYTSKGGIDTSDYSLTLYLLCIFKDKIVDHGATKDEVVARLSAVETYENGLYSLLPSFSVVSVFDTAELKFLLMQFEQLPGSYFESNFAELFETIFLTITESLFYKNRGNILHPKMGTLILSTVNINPYVTIYNPFAGNGDLIPLIADHKRYYGQEYSEKLWRIAQLRLYVYNKSDEFILRCENSLDHWPRREKFDLLFLNFTVPSQFEGIDEHSYDHDAETYFIDLATNSIKLKGRAIILLNKSYIINLLADPDDETFSRLISQNYIEKVLLFPSGVFSHTGTEVLALVINKRKIDDQIAIVDFREELNVYKNRRQQVDWNKVDIGRYKEQNPLGQTIWVDNGALLRNPTALLGNHFFIENPELVSLAEVLVPTTLPLVDDDFPEYVIRVSNLAGNNIFPSKFVPGVIDRQRNSYCVVRREGLLLTLHGRQLRASHFNGSYTSLLSPVIYHFTIQPKSKFTYRYLVDELKQDYVLNQVNAFSSSSMHKLSLESFLAIRIRKPRLEKSRNLFKHQKESFLTKEIQIDAAEPPDDFDEFYILADSPPPGKKPSEEDLALKENNALLRHKIAGSVSNLEFYAQSIKDILQQGINKIVPDLFQTKSNEKQILNLGQLLDHLMLDAKKIGRELRNHTHEFQVHEYHLYEVNLVDWVEEYFKRAQSLYPNIQMNLQISDDIFQADVDGKITNLIVNANEELLTILFDNIFSNIRQHAFNWTELENRRVELQVRLNNTDNKVLVYISNTGKPFPASFSLTDFKQRGVKFGETSGSGLGGYIISTIIGYLNGDWFILDESSDEGSKYTDLVTTFEISIPYII
ncbi:SAM-dependent methyltransferase [Sphingobacterium siyangense]|uniref:N-6 DNA methylase n=1 Tax=Sphingobacterium siyangense TaxID=459529 RepID=UPI00200BFDE5|nr:N-6 DNA methylase [Sphingobacterium siyangense]UQA76711.1 SAM-dependent methyltransferase [Sphingobacterium siyangense]